MSDTKNCIRTRPESFFESFEKQGDHRRELETYHLRSNVHRSFSGLAAGFVVTLAFLAAAVYLVMNGYEVAGVILGTVDLVALVTVFVIGNQMVKTERIEKTRLMQRDSKEEADVRAALDGDEQTK